VRQHRGFILATHARDDRALSPQALRHAYQGQKYAERGLRFRNDPLLLASSLDLNKPARIMALLMVMPVCLLVYAALDYRIRTALTVHQATFPKQHGHHIQHPTARWGFQSRVGIPLLLLPGPWPLVRNGTEAPQHLLRLLGDPDEAFSS
jgi:transposase